MLLDLYIYFLIQESVFLEKILIGRKLLFVLVSAIQQHKSVIIICIYSPSGASLPSPHPAPLGHHRVPDCTPCVIYGLLVSCTYPAMIECYAAS